MGYGIVAYAVNLEQVEKPFGSNNEALKCKIVSLSQDRMESLDDQLGGTSLQEFANDYFNGTINHREEAYKYWYWVEILCEGYGKNLDNSWWYPSSGAAKPWFDYEHFKLYGLETKPYIPSPDDFPTVFMVRNADLDNAYANIYDQWQKGIYTSEQTQQFQEWVEIAQKDKWDLVLFYY